MSKFTTAVCMACTQEQYERDLRKPLLNMGYRETDIRGIDNYPFIVNNHCGELGVITNLSNLADDRYDRYLIDHYNPELYLGLAAMTIEPFGIVGEWWICIKDVSMEDSLEIVYNQGRLYQCESTDCITDNLGDVYHYWTSDTYRFRYFRKATKEEIIERFIAKSDTKKDLYSMIHEAVDSMESRLESLRECCADYHIKALKELGYKILKPKTWVEV